jgi:DNA-directed RNA polymerase specialized sigma24 family protein
VWIDGMTQVEAGQVIGVSSVTVKRWLSRVLRLVTVHLADLCPGEKPPDAI